MIGSSSSLGIGIGTGKIYKCPECGQEFLLRTSYGQYTYKYRYKNKGEGILCCSYTCWDHAKLRTERNNYYSWKDLVVRCEDMMRSQGKDILKPIDTK